MKSPVDIGDETPSARANILINAARAGDLETVRAALAPGNVLALAGETAMAVACDQGHLAIVELLHAQGAAIDFSYTDVEAGGGAVVDHFPLRCAAASAHWRVVEWLYAQGVAPIHQSNLLANLVPGETALLTLHLDALPYIDAWQSSPPAAADDYQKFWMADAVRAALGVTCSEDNLPVAEIFLARGIPQETLYEQGMHRHSLQILQHLYMCGYQPPEEMLEKHHAFIAALEDPPAAAYAVRNLLRVWSRPPEVLVLTADERKRHTAALEQDLTAQAPGKDMPAAVVLTRAGHFATDIAPLAARQDDGILKAACRYGRSVADIAHARGELLAVFAPQLWTGREAAMKKTWQGLPEYIRRDIDYGLLSTALRQHQNRQSTASKNFRLGGRP